MGFKYSTDLSNDADSDFPDGEYDFKVLTAEMKPTKSNPQNSMLVLELEIFHPTKLGISMYVKEFLLENNKYIKWKIYNLFKSAGRPTLFDGDTEEHTFEGLNGRCSIKFEKGEKYSGYKVEKYIPKEDIKVTEIPLDVGINDEEIPF